MPMHASHGPGGEEMKMNGKMEGDMPMPAAPPMEGGRAAAPGEEAALAETAMQQQEAQIAAIVAATPEPDEAYDPRLLTDLADAINGFAAAVAGPEQAAAMPQVSWVPPANTKRYDAPLPKELWVPTFVINAAIEQAGFGKKRGYDPLSATTNSAVRKITAKLDVAAKDKKLCEAVRGAPAPAPAGEEPALPPSPSEPGMESEDEHALMGA